MKKSSNNKGLILLIVLIILLVSLLPFYYLKIKEVLQKNKFAQNVSETYTNYKNPIFTIDKIVYFSNAFVSDESNSQNFQNINIGQYTDIAIYINNTNAHSELTDENTIKELYIDNIKITSNSDKGERVLGYKNPYNFAKYKGVDSPKDGKISYNIIKSNRDNKESSYNNPSFYEDCSNPISLGYVNKNIVTNFQVPTTNSLSLNGTIFNTANITMDDLKFTLSLKIHIKNNKDEEFICNIKRPVLSEDYSSQLLKGYVATQYSPDKGTNQFIKILK